MEKKSLEVLIIEDQNVFRIWEACREVLPEYFGIEKEDIKINFAYAYNQAIKAIETKMYDIIFLDHALPQDEESVTVTDEKGIFPKVKYEDIEKIGYGLLPLIRRIQPNALVIGTSSLGDNELSNFESPKYRISKNDKGALRKVLDMHYEV